MANCVYSVPPPPFYLLRCSYFRTYHLKAESLAEAESWLSALRHTQVSGIPLGEQQLTSTGIPIVIHKCLQFVESIGLDVEGLYRISGEKTKIRKLVLAFNQGETWLCIYLLSM